MTPRTAAVSTATISRRGVLTGALALSSAAVLGGCGSSDPVTGGDGTGGPDGPWRFTDDSGRAIELAPVPTRIAGLTDQIAALWNLGITPVAAFGYTPMADDIAFDGLPIGEVVEAGSGYGEIDLEALAGAAPDLIVTTVYPVDSSGEIPDDVLLYGFKDEQQLEKVRQIAPVLAIAQRGSAKDVIARVELVASLGVDVDGGDVADAPGRLRGGRSGARSGGRGRPDDA